MKKLFAMGAFMALLSVGLIPSVSAQKNNWTPLFDGKTLKGWKQLNGQAKYEVQNGVIVGTAVPNTPNSFLTTEKDYGDFIFECEVNVDEGLNSGIQFRSLSKPDYNNGRVHGYQMEIDASDRDYSGGIYDEARRGWLYVPDANPKSKGVFLRNNQWNKYRIEAIGNSLRTFVNGVEISHVIDDLTPSGFICLQVHSIGNRANEAGKQVRWKNVRIQTTNLQPSPASDIRIENWMVNNISEAEKAQGYRLLWDGQTTKGWRGAYKTEFPKSGWNIKDGVLTVDKGDGGESTNGGDIITTDEFGAFELTFQFKLTEGANSGVKYFVRELLQYTHEFKPGQPMVVPAEHAQKGSAIGLEFQVLDDAKHPDAKMGAGGNRTIGSLYDLIPADKVGARKNSIKKIGDWNMGRIVVYPNNRVEHYLNGYKVVEYTRNSDFFKALVQRSKYAVWGDKFGSAEKGPILLQDHGDVVSYRSIKIRELK
ncbi:DUF1080 domain-containing protein [Runella sp. MFBS21]|uniref:3-keto-disaccharide hydrolase n=1 Tax=Runella sp. MFBS21 TaxID=3034018 RepID=UPI0023F77A7C|nr:DUF1080 domain-containing protein [Runella sp. MFBS21]MDF7820090.1 DUF1080 domain-containing protein [Runella sp. MFBS21]